MKSLYFLFICVSIFLFSCGTIQPKISIESQQTPILGFVGMEKSGLLKKEFTPFGFPVLNKGIAIEVKERPFNKSLANKYIHFKEELGQESTLVFQDSILPQPTYLNLELYDKLALQKLLNLKDNTDIKDYLAQDQKHRIIAGIRVYTDEELAKKLTLAEAVFLKENNKGILELELLTKTSRQRVSFTKLQIFDYETLGICWQEDLYGKPKIATMVEGSCPKETFSKVSKLNKNDFKF